MNSEQRMHYYVRLTAGGRPVVGSLIARVHKPKDGRWSDITECLGLCCDFVLPTIPSPANFAATPDSSPTTAIDLSWTAVPNAASYVVERSNSADFSTTVTQVYAGTATSTVANGLTTGTTYYFRVKAIANTGYRDSAYAYASRTTA